MVRIGTVPPDPKREFWEQLAAGERAEERGDPHTAAAAYRAVVAAGDVPDAVEARFRLGRLTLRQGNPEAALAIFAGALDLARQLGDPDLEALVQNGIGAAHHARDDHRAAREAYGAAHSLATAPALLGKITLNLGVIESADGHFDLARVHYADAVRLCEAASDTGSTMLALLNLGIVEVELGNWTGADGALLAALSLAVATGDRAATAKALLNHSPVLVELGSIDQAIEQTNRAGALYRELGDELGAAEALRWRAHAVGRSRDLAAACEDARAALATAVRLGATRLEAEAARDLGVLLGLRGESIAGRACLHQSLAAFTRLGARRDAAEIGRLLSRPTPTRSLERVDSPDASPAPGQAVTVRRRPSAG
jgi:tetratricopeptide (TPR) repeat protein